MKVENADFLFIFASMINKGLIIPNKLKAFLQMFGIALLFLTLTRIIFFLANYESFEAWLFNDFFVGIWFDAISVALISLPLFAWTLFPFSEKFLSTKIHSFIQKSLYILLILPLLIFNLLDVEYFKFTSKRSTVDLFSIVGAGNDINQLLFTFLRDFWLLILIFILLFWFALFLYKKWVNHQSVVAHSYTKRSFVFLCILTLLIIMGRGGIGLRPAGILTAAQYTSMQKTALVLNTPFTMLKSYGKSSLVSKEYYDKDELRKLYSPISNLNSDAQLKENTNVVVVILESFGKEWVGPKFTPFLDSLIGESYYFENAFANGKKSIEAMPSIFAGVPSWADNPYISSPYVDNEIETLITRLSKKGYSSAFFHGATNGSMRFDDFASLAGFEKYFGRTEYPNPEHFDGTWGIADEYFNPWAAKEMSKLTEPFVSGLFTLSSHHPYYIPEKYQKTIPASEHPIARAVAYGDLSLRKFFESAKQEAWFNNTVFVLVADHTPAGSSTLYKRRVGMYQIPLVIYSPTKQVKPGVHKEIVDQIDIYPSLIDLLTKDEKIYSYGQSFFDTTNAEALYYLEGVYNYLKGDYMLCFSQDQPTALYNVKEDKYARKDSLEYYPKLVEEMSTLLKAKIQVYNNDLINNKMTLGRE